MFAEEIRKKRAERTPSYENWLSKHEESLKESTKVFCTDRFGMCNALVSTHSDTNFKSAYMCVNSNELDHLSRWLDENGIKHRMSENKVGTPLIVWFVD